MPTSRLFLLLLGSLAALNPAQAAENPVTEIHMLTLQWTGLERQKDLLQANWRRDRPVLEQQLVLLAREQRELSLFLEASEQAQDEVEERRLQLLEQQTRLEQEQAALERSLAQAVQLLHALHPQLPPPLHAAWTTALPRLDDPRQTLSQRLQLVLELLGQLDAFQQKISVHETVMTLAGDREYLVKQIYLGLSHGWYITADQSFAAAGVAAVDGWQWEPVTDSTAIARIVDILERRLYPELVAIPLQLQTSAPGREN